MTFFRYPGGKSKFRKQIKEHVIFDKHIEYREVFFGGGSIGLDLEYATNNAWINDFDKGLYCLWKSVKKHPDKLIYKIETFVPSVNYFDKFKKSLNEISITPKNDDDIVEIGFQKLAIHQISYSGLGTMSGGPLGGRDQKSDYKIDCRWSPVYLAKNIRRISSLLQNTKITCVDYSELILDTSKQAFVYLDPPYYEKGSQLYQHSFNEEQHKTLASLLKETPHQWLLSYDDCQFIRNLYDWAEIITIEANYSIAKATKKTELLIKRK
jgi:DNA adenine methylase